MPDAPPAKRGVFELQPAPGAQIGGVAHGGAAAVCASGAGAATAAGFHLDQPSPLPPAPLPPASGVFPPEIAGYERIMRLGEGDAGVAYLEQRSVGGTFGTTLPVAVKYLRLARADTTALGNELRNMRKLAHPNVVAYLTSHACETHLAIVMEHCLWDGGVPLTLHAWLQAEHPDGLPEPVAQSVWAQLLAAVGFAHGCSVVHRDINPHNILLQALPGGRQLVKLADFGSSKDCQFTVPVTYRSTAAEYTAPERLLARLLSAARKPVPPPARERGAEDVWAVGVVLLAALHGCAPIGCFSRAITEWLADSLAARRTLVPLMRTAMAELAPRVTPACCDALLSIFTDDPDARPTADALAAHPWVAAAGYAPDGSHLEALLAQHGRQSDAAFEDVLRRATGGGAPEHMRDVAAAPGYAFDRWGSLVQLP
jgi:serine/threonine protein kinase